MNNLKTLFNERWIHMYDFTTYDFKRIESELLKFANGLICKKLIDDINTVKDDDGDFELSIPSHDPLENIHSSRPPLSAQEALNLLNAIIAEDDD